MMVRITERLAALSQNARQRWRWLGRALTIAAVLYLAVLLYVSGFTIGSIDWAAYGRAVFYSLLLYCASLLIQFIVWGRMISFHHQVSAFDLVIYARYVLLRRLPGGIWHWMGRTALYSGSTNIPARVILVGNFVEWAMLVLVSAAIAAAGWTALPDVLRGLLALVFFGLSTALAWSWQPRQRPAWLKLAEGIVWSAIYLGAWILGGLIFYLFVIANGGESMSWLQGIWIWDLTGGASNLLFIVPGGSGVREVILTFLMKPHLTPASILLVAVLMRVTFMLGDLIWGGLGLLLSLRISKPPEVAGENKPS